MVCKCKNESKNIEGMIRSVINFADQIVIVDDASEDNTVSIATKLGAKIVKGEIHHGHIERLDKQGFLTCTSGWILRMDADERLTPELQSVLSEISVNTEITGVKFARLNMFFGKPLKYGGWFESNRMGFFRTESWDREWDCLLHSQVPVNGKVITIPKEKAYIIHLDYERIEQYIERTLYRYSGIEAVERKTHVKAWHLIWYPLKKFFGRLIIRKGYKDGIHGLIVSLLLATYEMLILMQIWDNNR